MSLSHIPSVCAPCKARLRGTKIQHANTFYSLVPLLVLRLVYTCLPEAMRHNPPCGASRTTSAGSDFSLPGSSACKLELKGLHPGPLCQSLITRAQHMSEDALASVHVYANGVSLQTRRQNDLGLPCIRQHPDTFLRFRDRIRSKSKVLQDCAHLSVSVNTSGGSKHRVRIYQLYRVKMGENIHYRNFLGSDIRIYICTAKPCLPERSKSAQDSLGVLQTTPIKRQSI